MPLDIKWYYGCHTLYKSLLLLARRIDRRRVFLALGLGLARGHVRAAEYCGEGCDGELVRQISELFEVDPRMTLRFLEVEGGG